MNRQQLIETYKNAREIIPSVLSKVKYSILIDELERDTLLSQSVSETAFDNAKEELEDLKRRWNIYDRELLETIDKEIIFDYLNDLNSNKLAEIINNYSLVESIVELIGSTDILERYIDDDDIIGYVQRKYPINKLVSWM